MSSMWSRTKIWLGLEDEGFEEYEEGEAGPGESGSSSEYEGRSVESARTVQPPERPSLFEPQSGVRTMPVSEPAESLGGVRTLPASANQVHIVEAEGFNDAQELGEKFRGGQPVILNLRHVDRDTARRLVDFASGITFALRGSMQKVGEQVFLVTPSNVEVSTEERQRLRDKGLIR